MIYFVPSRRFLPPTPFNEERRVVFERLYN